MLNKRIRYALNITGLCLLIIGGAGCAASDRVRLNIGDTEKFDPPAGMFPADASSSRARRNVAMHNVIGSFQLNPESLDNNPARTMHVLAYLEWLANDLRGELNMAPHKIRKILDARDDLRKSVGMNPYDSVESVVQRYMAMSKFMQIYGTNTRKNEPLDVKQRREFLDKLKGKIFNVVKKSARLRKEAIEDGTLQVFEDGDVPWIQ